VAPRSTFANNARSDDDGHYRPAHKSLIEFFSAYKLAAAIGALKDEYVEAAGKHANVNRNLQPAGQQWSVYFRGTGGEGQVLPPLARFAKESAEELGKTWAQVELDDATSEFIFLLCGQSVLLRYVKIKLHPMRLRAESQVERWRSRHFRQIYMGLILQGRS
jgi:hypothetical protein